MTEHYVVTAGAARIAVLAEQLDAGFSYVNLSVSTSSDAHIASSLAIVHDLLVQRYPPNLAALST